MSLKISRYSDERKSNARPSSISNSSWPGRCWDGRSQIRIGPLVEKLHRLGPRPLLEFLSELVGNDQILAVDFEERLHHYARLEPALIDALDGREIRLPIAVIEGAR